MVVCDDDVCVCDDDHTHPKMKTSLSWGGGSEDSGLDLHLQFESVCVFWMCVFENEELSLLEARLFGSSVNQQTVCSARQSGPHWSAAQPWRQPRGKSYVNLQQMPPDSGGTCTGVD